jgi:hypothetical protein
MMKNDTANMIMKAVNHSMSKQKNIVGIIAKQKTVWILSSKICLLVLFIVIIVFIIAKIKK